MTQMTSYERFKRMFEHREADRVPIIDGPWQGTIARWHREGMPEGVDWRDYFAVDKLERVGVDISPRYEAKVIEDAARGAGGDLAALGLANGLTGVPRCDGEALLLPLAGRSGLERIDIRLFADGRYRAELRVAAGDPAMGQRLAAAGLQPVAGGYGLRFDGHF